MKIVISGATGHVGRALKIHWKDDEIVSIGRHTGVIWDGRTLGPWRTALEGADVLVNLAGRSVNCRYTKANLKEMVDSRLDSTRILGQAIAACVVPPKLWLQSSTATIYAHRLDAPNDDETGILGGTEPNTPRTWKASIDLARAWEDTFFEAKTPQTRKVALRSSMIMSPTPASVFGILASLARNGLGGRQGDGKHYISWIHEIDFCRALDFIIAKESIEGTINVCSPNPLPQADFARALRQALGISFAPPLPVWALELGAWLRQTETELILKSRRVVPSRMLSEGFTFDFPTWPEAALDLIQKLEINR